MRVRDSSERVEGASEACCLETEKKALQPERDWLEEGEDFRLVLRSCSVFFRSWVRDRNETVVLLNFRR